MIHKEGLHVHDLFGREVLAELLLALRVLAGLDVGLPLGLGLAEGRNLAVFAALRSL